jgi:hypothetical protein
MKGEKIFHDRVVLATAFSIYSAGKFFLWRGWKSAGTACSSRWKKGVTALKVQAHPGLGLP